MGLSKNKILTLVCPFFFFKWLHHFMVRQQEGSWTKRQKCYAHVIQSAKRRTTSQGPAKKKRQKTVDVFCMIVNKKMAENITLMSVGQQDNSESGEISHRSLSSGSQKMKEATKCHAHVVRSASPTRYPLRSVS